jgi:hypothetical protein
MIGRNLLRVIVVAILAVATPAFCGMPPPDVKPAPDTAWFVIGIQPVNRLIELKELRVKDGVVESYHAFPIEMTRPADGYIVFKARPGVVYGVVASSAMAGNSIFGIRYKACHQIATFQAEAGKVVYFTTFNYARTSGPEPAQGAAFYEGISYTTDLEGARAFLQTHYPGLSNSLEQGQYPMLPIIADSCF